VTIYLFCNPQYGYRLMRTALTYCAANKATLAIVLSARRPTPKHPAKRLLVRAWRAALNFAQERRLRLRYGVPVLLAENVNSESFLRRMGSGNHGIIAGFNQIFHKEIITRLQTFVNFHPSLLPLYRGPVPSYWCILNRERASGFTLHTVSEDLDAGAPLYQEIVPIEPGMDEAVLDQAIATAACPTMSMYLDHLVRGTPLRQKRVDAHRVYAKHVDYASFPVRQEPCSE
jgi:methionyl-tRNA formyltransferase